ncbi:MAG: hypothetical protein LBQ89_06965 [Treponema sp.]|jgi:hypothetical protein|nr:hypothetical protein [Treponema sp.]
MRGGKMEREHISIYNEKINEYLTERNENCSFDHVMEYVLEQTNIDEVIRVAVRSRDKTGRMHSHQRRIPKTAYGEFTEALLQVREKLINATNFDQIFSIVENEANKVYGAGEMFTYDTAFRIGKWRKIYPQKIYLHAGTREGIKGLMKGKKLNNYIQKDELEPPFNTCILECWQLEDFFCINKEIFSTNGKQTKKRKGIC